MTKIMGITALAHDAAISVIDKSDIKFAAHAERYSRIKNDKYLNHEIISEALEHGRPDAIAFYEHPWVKKTRQLYAGQYSSALTLKNIPQIYLGKFYSQLKDIPIVYVDHHQSHAAAGAASSPFKEACIVVIDAIGEWDCLTIWRYKAPAYYEKVYTATYPNSLGLFYTAMTHRVGLKPNEDEYILMGMAAYGEPKYADEMMDLFFEQGDDVCKMRTNLHRGCSGYRPEANDFDIAASAQLVIERKICEVMKYAKSVGGSENLVYVGGVALNCTANNHLYNYFNDVWIIPCPGDAGSSLGCAAFLSNEKVNWKDPYLGTNIEGDYPVESLTKALQSDTPIVGVANGKAEFGPRALGNRSLLADPRGKTIQDEVNKIKHRQEFRPFAPVILEHLASDYFEMPTKKSPYMQYVAKCKYPEDFPAIAHADGTSRVQTVNYENHPKLYELLANFHDQTGCPMLLNTSLNIKGQPIVNDEKDAMAFQEHYNTKVIIK